MQRDLSMSVALISVALMSVVSASSPGCGKSLPSGAKAGSYAAIDPQPLQTHAHRRHVPLQVRLHVGHL